MHNGNWAGSERHRERLRLQQMADILQHPGGNSAVGGIVLSWGSRRSGLVLAGLVLASLVLASLVLAGLVLHAP